MDPNWNDNDENDEENEDEGSGFNGADVFRDGIIFLIDATEDMFEKNDDEDQIPFRMCLKTALSTLTSKVISNDRDLIGIIFYGTEKNKNKDDFKHIYVFQELSQIGAERILELETLINLSDDKLQKEFGQNSSYSLSDSLWTCSSIFSECKLNMGERKIFLFTNCDNPHSDNPQLQRQTREKAKDLNDNKIKVKLFHIVKSGDDFDVKKFYRDIISLDNDEDIENLPDASEKLENLLTRVHSKASKKRTLCRIRFKLNDNLEFAVGVYNLVSVARKPTPVRLDKKNNESLKSMTKYFLQDSGELLLPTDLKKYQTYSQKKIYMDADEVNQIKAFSEPGLSLIGFKPISSLKGHLQNRSAKFIYPDEIGVSGSCSLFWALLQQCLRKKKMALCSFVPRKNTPPRIVVLLPQEEEKDEKGVQLTPPGFHLIFQPFSEDIRKLNIEKTEEPPNELTEKAKEIVKKLQFNFTPDSFQNPAIQTHWKNIEALALNRDETEEITDYTMPDIDVINKRAGKLVEEFKNLAFPSGTSTSSSTGGTKRKPKAAPSAPSKKGKTDSGVHNSDVKKAAEEGKLGSLTVSVLKQFCKSHGIPCGNKKADVIEAIEDYLNL